MNEKSEAGECEGEYEEEQKLFHGLEQFLKKHLCRSRLQALKKKKEECFEYESIHSRCCQSVTARS